ncbi:384_t:CDS:2 [Funneliformis geosporum]|nr:384_t:CDS:2 [Funneliformis geosporum]
MFEEEIKKRKAKICYKGVYPYKYIDFHDRFLETELPPIHEFHGQLREKLSKKIIFMLRKCERNLDVRI